MSEPVRLFGRITTTARLSDGRVIERSYSFPKGVDRSVYTRLDEELVRSFGNHGSRTLGEYLDMMEDIFHGS